MTSPAIGTAKPRALAFEARPKPDDPKTYVVKEVSIKGIAVSSEGVALQPKRGTPIIVVARDQVSAVWASAGPREITRGAAVAAMVLLPRSEKQNEKKGTRSKR